jgi:phosphatidylglycerophosphate synthase
MSAVAAAPRVVSKINPANAITAARYLTLPPFFWAVQNGHSQIAAAAIIICGLFDKLDGRFAKWFNCKSAFGELFDAITDGICYGFCLLVVIYFHWAPAVPAAMVVGLGALNTLMRYGYARRVGRNTNYKSYAMERIVAYVAFLIAFAIADYETQYFYWTIVMINAVVILYDGKRMLIDPIPETAMPKHGVAA